ncbi:MAG: F0F1 ATP synthase subunit delta [Candidatus Melainabacteria bacterium]|nr:F0F1 ATP synthase subunit delta [Candidatus Melainabacteria bacterium]
MKANKQIAKRYAQALFELTCDKAETIFNEIKSVNELINQIKGAIDVFNNPGITKNEKKQLLETLHWSVSTTTMNLLYILIDRQRFNLLPEIQNEFLKLINKGKGIVSLEVISTVELDPSTLEKLKVKFENLLNSDNKVTIKSRIEPGLIGGIKVKVNDLVYDGSIKGRLENLKRRLLA